MGKALKTVNAFEGSERRSAKISAILNLEIRYLSMS